MWRPAVEEAEEFYATQMAHFVRHIGPPLDAADYKRIALAAIMVATADARGRSATEVDKG